MYKKYLKQIFLYFFLALFFISALNYIIDPYGYQSRDGKFVKNLTMYNKPNVTNARINSDGYYYLIGSSRMARVNPQMIEKISAKKTHNIKIDGATLAENSLLASKVKENGNFFIYSFDAFSSNKSRQKLKEINNRFRVYEKELMSYEYLSKYYNSDITIRSLQHIIKSLKGENRSKQYDEENSRNEGFSLNNAFNDTGVGVSDNLKKANFVNFDIYSQESIIKLANLGTEKDIFIILPKYLPYYSLFSKYQNIQNQYFEAIRSLVLNTESKVWFFYGQNDITININNFIDNGWHFKPQVSNIIFKQVFGDGLNDADQEYGVLLTKDNLDNYLSKISIEISNASIDDN